MAHLGNNFLVSARENEFVSMESMKSPFSTVWRVETATCIIPVTRKKDKDEIMKESSHQEHRRRPAGLKHSAVDISKFLPA